MAPRNRLSDSGGGGGVLIWVGAGALGLGVLAGLGLVLLVWRRGGRRRRAASRGGVRVVFEWFGGNDGLNTIVPYGDPMYYKHRPTIGIKEKDLLEIDAHLGWHKSMSGMKAALRRRQGGHRPGRGLRPAVVLALHVDVVLAHGRAQQRKRVRLDRTDGVGAGSRRRAPEPDREHLRQPDAGREGREARAAGVHRPDEVPARGVRAGEGGRSTRWRAARAGGRRAQVRAGGHEERGAGLGGGAGRVEQIQRQGQPGPAPARPRQGGGAHRGGLPHDALLRAAAQQPVRHAREPGVAPRSAARVLLGRHRRLLPGDEAHRPSRRRRDVRAQRVRPPCAGEHQPGHRPRHGAGELRDRQRGEGRALREAAEPDEPGARRQSREHDRLPPGLRHADPGVARRATPRRCWGRTSRRWTSSGLSSP